VRGLPSSASAVKQNKVVAFNSVPLQSLPARAPKLSQAQTLPPATNSVTIHGFILSKIATIFLVTIRVLLEVNRVPTPKNLQLSGLVFIEVTLVSNNIYSDNLVIQHVVR